MTEFLLNGSEYSTAFPEGAVTLDMIRREAGLKGTKEGCREGDCGACTVLLGIPYGAGIRYQAVCSCILPVGELRGRHLVTIEGLSSRDSFSLVQKAFVDQGASQCGFCTPGMILSLTGYLLSTTRPDAEGAVGSLGGNICRCTGYIAVRKAVETVVAAAGRSEAESPFDIQHLEHLVSRDVLPPYFLDAAGRLRQFDQDTGRSGDSDEGVINVAGGTDLFPTAAEELRDKDLSFILRKPELTDIALEGDGTVRFGAAVTVTDIQRAGIFSGIGNLHESLMQISSMQIRNRATAGGNIVNASPIGDLAIILLALDSELRISGPDGARDVPLRDFYSGYKIIDLGEDELIESIAFTRPGESESVNFEKVAMRRHLDIASVNSAARFEVKEGVIEKAVISAGGVAAVPMILQRTCSDISGLEISAETVLRACENAGEEVTPIDDVRGSAEYKRTLLMNLIKAHFLKLFHDRLDPEDLL